MGTILSIEDDMTTMNILRLFLERFDYEFYGATSAAAGLEMAHATKPDVIIMDLLMPEISGWEAIERLKGDSKVAHIPIIVLSALTDSASQTRAFEAGANSYLMKPFRFYDLKRRIDDLLELSAAVLGSVSRA
jgi:putative two-component system response regulator